MALEDLVRIVSAFLLLTGWLALAVFGIIIYLDVRKVSKDVIAARLFIHFPLFMRAFLVFSIGFAAVLIAVVPASLRFPGAAFISLAGVLAWFVCILMSFWWFFTSLHVPRAIRAKYGKPSQP